jgi:hypothetical protein
MHFRKVTTPRCLYRCCEHWRQAFEPSRRTANSSLIGQKMRGGDYRHGIEHVEAERLRTSRPSLSGAEIRKAPASAHATTRALPWCSQAPQGLMLGTSTAPRDLSHERQQQAIVNTITLLGSMQVQATRSQVFLSSTQVSSRSGNVSVQPYGDGREANCSPVWIDISGLFAMSLILSAITI